MCEEATKVWVGEYPGEPKSIHIGLCNGEGEDNCGFWLDGFLGVFDADAEGGYITYWEMQRFEERHRSHDG